MKAFIGGAIGLLLAAQVNVAQAIIIDFEGVPPLATGPSVFASAGPAQAITVGGITLSGGVVLGFPTFLPATPFATTPNLYGTANHPAGGAVGDPSLQPALSITLDAPVAATTIEGLLFNGLIAVDSFLVQAFSGAALVDSVSLDDLPANLANGFDVFRLDSGGPIIDLVTIAADLSGPFAGEWDFFIDTVAVNEPIENVLADVAEPSALALLGFVLAG
ncbi:MAG: hypothetical protein HC871_06000 [Rhizobiales bacterium]|nr:hypothetical protein [Hyphomicrobiales bacterium]